MADPQDRVEIDGIAPIRAPDPAPIDAAARRRPWLSVWFNCCSTYARIYRNNESTAYEGRCPRCRARVQALIGQGGTDRRMFETS